MPVQYIQSQTTIAGFVPSTQIISQAAHLRIPFTDRKITIPAKYQTFVGAASAKIKHNPLLVQAIGMDFGSENLKSTVLNQSQTSAAQMKELDQQAHQMESASKDQMDRARISQAIIYFKEGQIQEAIQLIESLLKNFTDEQSILKMLALIVHVDLKVAEATVHQFEARDKYLDQAMDSLIYKLPGLVKKLPDGHHADGLQTLVTQVYAHVAQMFLIMRAPVYAVQTVQILKAQWPDSQAVQDLALPTNLMAPFIDRVTGEINQQVSDTGWQHLWAGATQAVANGQFRTNGGFWKTAMAAGLGAAILADTTGTVASMKDLLLPVAMGATSVVALAKTFLGVTAPQTQQAYKTGYGAFSPNQFLKSLGGQILKLAATWVCFGGDVPAIGMVPTLAEIPGITDTFPDVFYANRTGPSGQLHGVGSLISQGYGTLSHYGAYLTSSITECGWSQGLANFRAYSEQTPFGATFFNGADLTRQLPETIMNKMGQGVDVLKDCTAKIANKETWMNPWTYVFGLGAPVVLAGGLYSAVGLVKPKVISQLKKRFEQQAKWVEPVLFGGSWLFSTGVGVATGVPLLSALGIPFAPVIGHFVRHWQNSGKVNDIDLTALGRAGLAQFLYAGTGAAILAGAITVDDGSLWSKVQMHAGVVGYMISIGVFHALILGTSLENLMKFKLAQAFTYALPAEVLRVTIGWDTFWGTSAEILTKHGLLGPPTRKSYSGMMGSKPQVITMRSKLQVLVRAYMEGELAFKEKAKNFEDEVAFGARRWKFSAPFTGQNLAERSPVFTALKLTDPAFPTTLFSHYFRYTWHGILIDEETETKDVIVLLNTIKEISEKRNSDRKDIHHAFLLTILSARQGTHRELINDFIAENVWLYRYYGIDPSDPGVPQELLASIGWTSVANFKNDLKVRSWFEERLQGRVASADGIVRTPFELSRTDL